MTRTREWTVPWVADPRRRARVHVLTGRLVRVTWAETVGAASQEWTDVSLFGFDTLLAAGHPAWVVTSKLGGRFLEELLAFVRPIAACDGNRCLTSFRDPKDHGGLSPGSEQKRRREAGRTVYRHTCQSCGRTWDVVREAGRATSVVGKDERVDRRTWSLTSRSGGTPQDCVDHESLTVSADGVMYESRPDGTAEPPPRRMPFSEFLRPDEPLRRTFSAFLAEMDAEIRLRMEPPTAGR